MLEIKQPVWYRTSRFQAKPTNKALGLEDIKVYPANAVQKSYGLVCNCLLVLNSGSIRITVAESKKKPGTLYIITPGQEKVVDDRGNPTYFENVQIRYELQGQILKYIDSLLEQA